VSVGWGGDRTTVLAAGFFFGGLDAAVAAEVPANRSATIANTIIASARLDMWNAPLNTIDTSSARARERRARFCLLAQISRPPWS
jgi:hypothetical protein